MNTMKLFLKNNVINLINGLNIKVLDKKLPFV